MNIKYYQAWVSAENKDQANIILDTLLKNKLILGGPILEGPAKFWWKGQIVGMNYAYIVTYTIDSLKHKIIEECRKVSVEEVPMISFIPFECNEELTKLIDETLI